MGDTDDIDEIRECKREELLQAATGPDEPVHVSGPDHLREHLEGHDVVLADFYADWCGPCQVLEPVVEDLAAETDAVVAKIDVDAQQGLASEYGVRGVPTLILFAGGDPVERVVGVTEKDELASLVAHHS